MNTQSCVIKLNIHSELFMYHLATYVYVNFCILVQYRVFTLDPVNFALPKMTEFVDYLHNKSMKYGMFMETPQYVCFIIELL